MKLAEYLELTDLSQAEFAKGLGVSRQLVNQWCAGRQIPRKEMMLKIKKVTGNRVGLGSWYEA